jgi:8-oxo-dGTP pyrophosphatase MutT (NUDIX family)
VTDYFAGGEVRLQPGNAAVALIVVGPERRYLMQLRDQKPGIFYPGHWGLFGGAMDAGESTEDALLRELQEELGLKAEHISYFTDFTFDFGFCGHGRLGRSFYEVVVAPEAVKNLKLGEGSAMRLFSAQEILTAPRVVPFDAFAIWLHAIGSKVMKARPPSA